MSNLRNGEPNVVAAESGKLVGNCLRQFRVPVRHRLVWIHPTRIWVHVFEVRNNLHGEIQVGVSRESKIDKIVEECVFMTPEAVIEGDGRRRPQPVYVKIALIDDASKAPDPSAGNEPPPLIFDQLSR